MSFKLTPPSRTRSAPSTIWRVFGSDVAPAYWRHGYGGRRNCSSRKTVLPHVATASARCSDMLTLLKDDPKLKVVLKEFPILGPGLVEAARVAIAARMQDPTGQKYLALR